MAMIPVTERIRRLEAIPASINEIARMAGVTHEELQAEKIAALAAALYEIRDEMLSWRECFWASDGNRVRYYVIPAERLEMLVGSPDARNNG